MLKKGVLLNTFVEIAIFCTALWVIESSKGQHVLVNIYMKYKSFVTKWKCLLALLINLVHPCWIEVLIWKIWKC